MLLKGKSGHVSAFLKILLFDSAFGDKIHLLAEKIQMGTGIPVECKRDVGMSHQGRQCLIVHVIFDHTRSKSVTVCVVGNKS